MKRFLRIVSLLAALCLLPVLALAEEVAAPAEDAIGAAAVEEGKTYTLQEMLTFALEDEYLAKAEYDAIQEAFGADNPFSSIMQAEITHQEMLFALFEAYGIPVPEDTAKDHVAIPATLQETYTTGVEAEVANIAMYNYFLSQDDVPQDVIDVFTALRDASQSHLEAFTRNADKFN